jgi:FtsP/CotA-like multicopper oxidase with cupredoxin domain
MKKTSIRSRASGALAVVAAALVLLTAGSAGAQAVIDGITGTNFEFTAGEGQISTPDGSAIHFWGYQDLTKHANPFEVPQYPGPTLIVNQGDTITVTLTNNLPIAAGGSTPVQNVSILFPGQVVTATGGTAGLLTQESTGPSDTVTYTFTATNPGTYTYFSGTEMELQVEMGLVGALIVRPAGFNQASSTNRRAYADAGSQYTHEFLFLMTQMDPIIHQLVEQQRFNEIVWKDYWPVYWFFNGRAGPDDLADAFVSWLPHQPYNCTPRMTPGQKLFMRLVGGDQGNHPFHYHGNNADIIARDGRRLADPRSQFTTLSVPGETVDQIFTWTGEKMGWDIYGHAVGDPMQPGEYAPDHGKPLPVVLPENQNLTFGGWWSGSPFLGSDQPLPPGEGGLNPNSGYFFMWHSHAEKELTNWDIFPGGMMSMMVVEPPGTPIP